MDLIALRNVMHLEVENMLRDLIVNCAINSIILEPFRNLLYVFSNRPVNVVPGIKLYYARNGDYDTSCK